MPWSPISLIVARATSGGRVLASITDMSGLTSTPPLKPAIGVSSASGSISIAMPRGGRPLVMAKRMPVGPQRLHGGDGALGQHLLLGDQRAVDIGEQDGDLALGHGRAVMIMLARPGWSALPLAAEHVALDGLGEPLVLVTVGHHRGACA